MLSTGRAFLVAVSIVFFAALATVAQPLQEGVVDTLDLKAAFPPIESDSDSSVVWSNVVERPGSRFLRLQFSAIKDTPTDAYTVLIVDRNGQVVFSYAKEEFSAEPEFWSNVIDGSYARIDVIAPQRPAGLSFSLSAVAHEMITGVPYSLKLPDDRENIIVYESDLPTLFDKGRAIAKLVFTTSSGSFSCTGFMVRDNLLLTNEHCINTKALCKAAVAIFGYQVGKNGFPETGKQHRCTRLVEYDADLDFALLEIDGKPGAVYGTLTLSRDAPEANGQLYLVQHPKGEPKQVSRKGCSVSTVSGKGYKPDSDIGHVCDTLKGSSGSPVLNKTFKVIGLHHLGFDESGVWASQNRAVKMSLILDKLGW